MKTGFDWDDKEMVIVRPTEGVAAYVNDYGDIVLRQGNHLEEESIIVIPGDRAEAVAQRIWELAEQAE